MTRRPLASHAKPRQATSAHPHSKQERAALIAADWQQLIAGAHGDPRRILAAYGGSLSAPASDNASTDSDSGEQIRKE